MPCPQKDLSIQYVTSVSLSMTKLATLPTSRPSRVTARWVTSGEVLTFAMWRSNAARSSGSPETKAAIRTDSGSRICSNKASRSESSTSRSATSATSAPQVHHRSARRTYQRHRTMVGYSTVTRWKPWLVVRGAGPATPVTCGKGSPDWTRTSNPSIRLRGFPALLGAAVKLLLSWGNTPLTVFASCHDSRLSGSESRGVIRGRSCTPRAIHLPRDGCPHHARPRPSTDRHGVLTDEVVRPQAPGFAYVACMTEATPFWSDAIAVERGDVIVLPNGRIGTVDAYADNIEWALYGAYGAHDIDGSSGIEEGVIAEFPVERFDLDPVPHNYRLLVLYRPSA